MTLRRIDAETLLTPPEPPRPSIVMLGMSLYQLMLKLLQPIDNIKQIKP